MNRVQDILNLLWVYTISVILISIFIFQTMHHLMPCTLCLLQRLCMIGITIGPLLNMRFGAQPQHYALSILSATLGAMISLSQIALHACNESPSAASNVIMGFELYTWSFIVFASSLVASALLLFIYQPQAERKLNLLEKGAFLLTFLVAIGNAIALYLI